jgi:hypothetical protein
VVCWLGGAEFCWAEFCWAEFCCAELWTWRGLLPAYAADVPADRPMLKKPRTIQIAAAMILFRTRRRTERKRNTPPSFPGPHRGSEQDTLSAV